MSHRHPMNPLALVAFLLLAGAGAAACAPSVGPTPLEGGIAFGQRVEGELTAADPTLDDGSHYDLWRFRGAAGQRVIVTLRSDDFDAFLAVGPDAVACGDGCEVDDDGAGDLNSRVRMTLPAAGIYEIRANSLGGGETGRYSLTLEDAGVAPQVEPRGPVAVGGSVRGELDAADPTLDDDSHFELWTLRARAGEAVEITLRSSDFDAFLSVGRHVGGVWTEIDSDDDGAGGTDSRLEFTAPAAGDYHIRVSSFSGGETGAYTLQVQAR
jgi:hypothetical protein